MNKLQPQDYELLSYIYHKPENKIITLLTIQSNYDPEVDVASVRLSALEENGLIKNHKTLGIIITRQGKKAYRDYQTTVYQEKRKMLINSFLFPLLVALITSIIANINMSSILKFLSLQ